MSGERLKTTKSDIVTLDEQLAEADVRRKKLQMEVAERRAKNKDTLFEVRHIRSLLLLCLLAPTYPLLASSATSCCPSDSSVSRVT